MRKIKRLAGKLLRRVIAPLATRLGVGTTVCIYRDTEHLDINLDLADDKQKRVLVCYKPCLGNVHENAYHSLMYCSNQIVHYFISKGFCVDVCDVEKDCMQNSYSKVATNRYDLVFGFGPIFKRYCREHDVPLAVVLATENEPETVREKYAERLVAFSSRHPDADLYSSSPRTDYYDRETFELADAVIVVNSALNAENFRKYVGDRVWRVNTCAIMCEPFVLDAGTLSRSVVQSRRRFLWFGSRGLIHKGLDILIDVFRERPDLELDCYGVSEEGLFDSLKADANNISRCGTIDVRSPQFVSEVVGRHCFVILDSCSEGMSTAVATCMAHGIIPIVSRETGYDPAPCIVELDGYDIQAVRRALEYVLSLSDDKVTRLREECFRYARKNFSIGAFDAQFHLAMDAILSQFDI